MPINLTKKKQIYIEKIVFYDDPKLKFKRILTTYVDFFPKSIPFIFKSMPIEPTFMSTLFPGIKVNKIKQGIIYCIYYTSSNLGYLGAQTYFITI